MATEPVITFRGMAGSPALEADIRERVRKLDACCGRIVSCHVVVELGERRHESGNRFHVRIHLVVPRGEIVIAHSNGVHPARDGSTVRRRKANETDREMKRAYVAVRQAFEVARRQLQDFTRRRRAKTTSVARKRARRAQAAAAELG
jgi:hypothetical protein